jgi:hypothetical protein
VEREGEGRLRVVIFNFKDKGRVYRVPNPRFCGMGMGRCSKPVKSIGNKFQITFEVS